MAQKLLLLVRDRSSYSILQEANPFFNGGEGGAQFVGHGGEEIRLHLIHFFSLSHIGLKASVNSDYLRRRGDIQIALENTLGDFFRLIHQECSGVW